MPRATILRRQLCREGSLSGVIHGVSLQAHGQWCSWLRDFKFPTISPWSRNTTCWGFVHGNDRFLRSTDPRTFFSPKKLVYGHIGNTLKKLSKLENHKRNKMIMQIHMVWLLSSCPNFWSTRLIFCGLYSYQLRTVELLGPDNPALLYLRG